MNIHRHCLGPLDIVQQVAQMGLLYVFNVSLNNKKLPIINTKSEYFQLPIRKEVSSRLPSNPSTAEHQRSEQTKPFQIILKHFSTKFPALKNCVIFRPKLNKFSYFYQKKKLKILTSSHVLPGAENLQQIFYLSPSVSREANRK